MWAKCNYPSWNPASGLVSHFYWRKSSRNRQDSFVSWSMDWILAQVEWEGPEELLLKGAGLTIALLLLSVTKVLNTFSHGLVQHMDEGSSKSWPLWRQREIYSHLLLAQELANKHFFCAAKNKPCVDQSWSCRRIRFNNIIVPNGLAGKWPVWG